MEGVDRLVLGHRAFLGLVTEVGAPPTVYSARRRLRSYGGPLMEFPSDLEVAWRCKGLGPSAGESPRGAVAPRGGLQASVLRCTGKLVPYSEVGPLL